VGTASRDSTASLRSRFHCHRPHQHSDKSTNPEDPEKPVTPTPQARKPRWLTLCTRASKRLRLALSELVKQFSGGPGMVSLRA
jgi:hypothetical protein